METSSDWKKSYRTAMFVHTAMVALLFVYAILLEILKASLHPMPRLLAVRTTVQALRYLFYAAAIGAVLVVRLVNRRLLAARPGESLREFLHRLLHAAVFTSILCGAPAVLGLILVFLEGASLDFYYLVFVSLFLAFLYYPRRRTWAGMIGDRFPPQGA